MEIIQLPPVLPDTLDLVEINQKLKDGEIKLGAISPCSSLSAIARKVNT